MDQRLKKNRFCLTGGTVLTFDDQNSIFEDGEIWFEGNQILFVGSKGEFKNKGQAEIIDQRGKIICPGFINAHTHSYSSLLKGSIECDPLDLYMLKVIATGSAMSPREIEIAATLDAASMLLSGTTGVIDHFSERPNLSTKGLNAVRRGFETAGIRATIATMFADKPYIDTIPLNRNELPDEILAQYEAQSSPDIENYFSIMEKIVLENSEDRLTRVMLGVDGPQRCKEELLQRTGEFQRRHHCGLHTHMLETKTQAVMAPNAQKGFVSHLLDLGLLDNFSSLVHFVWASENDISAAKEAGVTVIHCPASNMMLGAGVSPILKLREANIPVAFGTDGSNCGPPSLFETMRLGCFLMRLTDPNFEKWVRSEDILKLNLSSGSRAMGWDGKLGVLKKGALADLISLDLSGHWHEPYGDITSHLLYYETGQSVSDVWVDGQRVVNNRKLTSIDINIVLEEAAEIRRKRQLSLSADTLQRIELQYPAFKKMIVDTLEHDFPIERRMPFS